MEPNIIRLSNSAKTPTTSQAKKSTATSVNLKNMVDQFYYRTAQTTQPYGEFPLYPSASKSGHETEKRNRMWHFRGRASRTPWP